MRKVPEIIIETSRKLRKEMTISEIILWKKLKSKQLTNTKFIRQAPVYVYTEDLLINLGYKIIRFKNEEIHNNLEKILIKIVASFSGQGERI